MVSCLQVATVISILKTDSVEKIPTTVEIHFSVRHQFYIKD